jgi:hypothetical protein
VFAAVAVAADPDVTVPNGAELELDGAGAEVAGAGLDGAAWAEGAGLDGGTAPELAGGDAGADAAGVEGAAAEGTRGAGGGCAGSLMVDLSRELGFGEATPREPELRVGGLFQLGARPCSHVDSKPVIPIDRRVGRCGELSVRSQIKRTLDR